MKLLLLACVAAAYGSPLRGRSNSASVYDYYDFLDIPRTQPVALSRADGPPPRRPSPLRHQAPWRPPPQKASFRPSPLRAEDYQLAGSEIFHPQPQPLPQYRAKPRPQPYHRPRPSYQSDKRRRPEPPVAFREEPVYVAEEPVYAARPHFQEDLVSYKDDPVVYHEEPIAYVERPQFHDDLPEYHEKHPSFQNERPPYQERPVYQSELPQYQDERPQYQEERPQYHDERPQYQEERPQFHEELEPYHDEPPHYQEERPSSRPERPAYEEQPREKEFRRPPANDFAPALKEEESVKEKRQVAHGGGHFDEAGEKFAADAAAVENAKGAGRLAFQIHGQQGPHSYRFGYDTGKGKNRQFRYEERDGYGQVHGRYGFYDKDGKLQVVNYSAHPEHGFSADVPHP
ncbi:early nodulin-75-like [Penaeus monodon]|uniref:early nodulin-75-like n=1 Tax=Penaeus monodon TaxID=6687 RepID=UPI0018A79340|nr:early nodulin-75-like [Penaeus monodon]